MQIQNERVQYEYYRRQQEIDSLQADFIQEKSTNDIIMWSMITSLIMTMVVSILLFKMLRMRKRRQEVLQQVDQIRISFFTNITHEFRTPLTVIIGFAEQLGKKEVSNERLLEIGQMIERQGKNLLLLINQILDVSKMKSVIPLQDYKYGNIVGYIHTVVEGTRELAQRKHIRLLFSSSRPSIEMDFIPDYINKIITNLVANAIKFTPKNGQIFVTADTENNKLKLRIADNGCGISSDEIPHIFDIFYQGGNSKREVGSGVGLALVRQLVETMNGTIDIRSAEGEGSIFMITLPLRQGNQEWDSLESEPQRENLIHDEGESPENNEEEIEDQKAYYSCRRG